MKQLRRCSQKDPLHPFCMVCSSDMVVVVVVVVLLLLLQPEGSDAGGLDIRSSGLYSACRRPSG
jgi:hypothetical protein